jgi:hypothetical protein
MKTWQFIFALVLGFTCAGLSAFGIVTGMTNQGLQGQLQQQQLEINRGNLSQQVGTNLVRDIASKAGTNENLKNLLTRNGFAFNDPSVPATGQQQHSAPAPTPKR